MSGSGRPANAIAIIGMAGRFPGAPDLATFWDNLCAGRDSITRFAPADGAASIVGARGVLQDADLFDAEYFQVQPAEAERMDPQHRVLLEVAASALDHAGYAPATFPGDIGLFAGCSLNTYLLHNLIADRGDAERLALQYQVGEFATALGNDKDFLSSRIAYKLNLRGPVMTLQAACATSLVAVCQAAQSLLNGLCDMALAGGVSITFPQERGHSAQDGGMASDDGLCRPFDAAASGTVFGHGAGMVLLKRLDEAVNDGDTIHAVLRGFAVNNDGSGKASYMAPGVAGQVRVIRAAQAMAEVLPEQISYVEAHGTGTPLGDPIEFHALTEAFRSGGDSRTQACVLGSVKGNTGHLDAAAGVTGLIKTVLALQHRKIPGTAHFQTPNPHLDAARSPFQFRGQTTEWEASGPRLAGVSAFGVGGVNAHVIVEEYLSTDSFEKGPATGLPICISGRTPQALLEVASSLATYLDLSRSGTALGDVAYTLLHGRSVHAYRFAFAAQTPAEAADALRGFALEGRTPVSAGTEGAQAALAWQNGDASAAVAMVPAGRRVPLPVYPFQRKRYWIEPPSQTVAPATAAANPAPPAQDVPGRIVTEIAACAGVSIPEADFGVPFLELGLDSLTLAQAAQALTTAFGLRIGLRQMMETADSVSALAAYVAERGVSVPAPEGKATVRPAGHAFFRAPDVQGGKALSTPQAAYLQGLIARYTARTPGSREATALARPHMADPRAAAGFRTQWKDMVYPLVTDRAAGSRIWDVDGNEYIDIVNGFGCILFGHSPAFVLEAATRQLATGVAIGPQARLAGETARMIHEMTGMERVAFCNTGSEAVMAAIRIARTVTGRDRIVYFAGAYHGTIDEVLVRSTPAGTAPVAQGIPVANLQNVTVLEYGTPAALEYLRLHVGELAAVLIEPVQSRHPDVQPVEFLRAVRALTHDAGAAFIFDEIVTGFRAAQGGCQEIFGIRADICTYGKVLGGGHPIGVVAGAARFMDALDGGDWKYGDSSVPETGVTFFAGTFVRHPLAIAVAHAVLVHLREHGPALQQELNCRTAQLAASVGNAFQQRGIACAVHTFASWFYFVLPTEGGLSSLFYFAMRDKGIHIQEGFPCFLTAAHTDEDILRIERAFHETIAELHGAEILHGGGGLPAAAPSTAQPFTAPMTEAQREIFLAANLGDEANCAFNESLTLELHGPVDVARLQRALENVLQRHDALRSVVERSGERLVVQPALASPVTRNDVRHMERAAQLAAVQDYIQRDAAVPFDLYAGPLVRACVFSMESGATVVLTAHHMVLDGWSANLLLQEFAAVYNGGNFTLSPAARFSEYAAAEEARRKAGGFDEHEAYWLDLSRGTSPKLELPMDRPRPALREFNGATFTGALPAGTTGQIRAYAREQGCSLYVVLLSAFTTLLHRITGQGDVVVGVSVAGQAAIKQPAVGHMVHFLPLQSHAVPSETVAEHLRRVRSSLLDAQEHSEYTFGSLLHKLNLDRDSSRMPLIEVQFNLESFGKDLHFDGLVSGVRSNGKRFVNTDLFLNVMETEHGLDISCDFNRGLFDRDTIARWMGIWELLLEGAAEAPDALTERLPVLSVEQSHTMLAEWNSTSADLGIDLFPQLFADCVDAQPEAIAAVCNGQQWTYCELYDFSVHLARRLRAQGVGPGNVVAICVDRSLELLGSILGTIYAGAAFLCLNARDPLERLHYMMSDSGASVLLTGRDPRFSSTVPQMDVTAPASVMSTELLPAVEPESLAYLIYTSGSTGTPKGVEVEHHSLRNLLLSMQRTPGFQSSDKLVAVTTPSFDIALLELLLPLVCGGQVVLATEEEAADAFLLSHLLHHSAATVMQATPGLWRILLDTGWTGGPGFTAMCGGESMSRELAADLLPRVGALWNMYGPTETTIWSSATRLLQAGETPRIGPPIANTQLYLLDNSRLPVPVGVVGELYISGEGVARGYHGLPQLTAERFIASPFEDLRLYRTGDLGRWDKGGTIELLGRSDFQVKIRGHRIELGEIEAALRSLSGVKEAVVLHALVNGGTQHALRAFVQAAPGECSSRSLLEHLQRNLPAHMVPQDIAVLTDFPRTTSGKVDRKALLSTTTAQGTKTTIAPPETETEKMLASIWREMLGVENLSVTESIFSYRADSLTVFRMAARCQREGIPVRAADIMRQGTIRALAAHATGQTVATSAPAAAGRIQAMPRQNYILRKG